MRVQLNEGQELLRLDLNELQSSKEREMYDRVLHEMLLRSTNGFLNGSCLVTYVNATTVQVAAGLGFQYDATQLSPEPTQRPIYVASNTNKTVTAAHATLGRIDIVSIKSARVVTNSETRRYKATTSSTPTTVSFDTRTDWSSDIVVTAGTASGSPVAPSTPAGYIKIATLTVTAATGLTGSGAVEDNRTFLISTRDDSVTAAKITANAVTTVKINDSAVTEPKLGNLAVTTTKIAEATITQSKLAARATGTTVAAGGVALSASCGFLTFTNTTLADLTNLSVTITTTGRPVFIGVIPDGSAGDANLGGNNNAVTYEIQRDGTRIGGLNYGSQNSSYVPIGAIQMVDFPAAGTYTYKIQGKVNTGTGIIYYGKLVAYEL